MLSLRKYSRSAGEVAAPMVRPPGRFDFGEDWHFPAPVVGGAGPFRGGQSVSEDGRRDVRESWPKADRKKE
jgi:hypothetical protein